MGQGCAEDRCRCGTCQEIFSDLIQKERPPDSLGRLPQTEHIFDNHDSPALAGQKWSNQERKGVLKPLLCRVTMSLLDLIIHLAKNALDYPEKYLRAGHNGPYKDPETNVRNLGHWLITFSKCYEWTHEDRFKNRVCQIAEYLCSDESRPYRYSFHHRKNKNKDKCNGLIGQAWTFEALAEASRLLGEPMYASLAEQVFFQHPFNEELGLWNRVDVDGNVLSEDPTFNHQLWFAACISLVKASQSERILKRVKRFLDCLNKNLTVLPNGLAYHPIQHLWEKDLARHFTLKGWSANVLYHLLDALKHQRLPEKRPLFKNIQERTHEAMFYKSIGYHAFNIYAFSLLRQQMQDYPFWSSSALQKMVDYLQTDEYRRSIWDNKYGFPYNPPGFEIPFSLFVLKGLSKEELIGITQHWAGEQFRRCLNSKTGKMERNTEDPETHTARLYELTRLPKELLQAVEISLCH